MATNWQPFQPQGWGGTFAGAALVFFAYIGFDAVSTVAEETKILLEICRSELSVR